MSTSLKPITPWYPSLRGLRGGGSAYLGLSRLGLLGPRARHLRKAIAVDGQVQTACVERVQRRVSVHPAVQRLVPRCGRFSPISRPDLADLQPVIKRGL